MFFPSKAPSLGDEKLTMFDQTPCRKGPPDQALLWLVRLLRRDRPSWSNSDSSILPSWGGLQHGKLSHVGLLEGISRQFCTIYIFKFLYIHTDIHTYIPFFQWLHKLFGGNGENIWKAVCCNFLLCHVNPWLQPDVCLWIAMVLLGHFDRQLCGCSISFAFSGASEWGAGRWQWKVTQSVRWFFYYSHFKCRILMGDFPFLKPMVFDQQIYWVSCTSSIREDLQHRSKWTTECGFQMEELCQRVWQPNFWSVVWVESWAGPWGPMHSLHPLHSLHYHLAQPTTGPADMLGDHPWVHLGER